MQECLSLNCKRNITHLFSLTFGLKNKINKNRISKMGKTFKIKLKLEQHLGIWQFWGLIYSLSKATFTQSVCGIDNRIYSLQRTQSLINGSPTATEAKTSIWHSSYHHLRVSEIMHEKMIVCASCVSFSGYCIVWCVGSDRQLVAFCGYVHRAMICEFSYESRKFGVSSGRKIVKTHENKKVVYE